MSESKIIHGRTLRIATMRDHLYIRDLQQKHAKCIGFIPDEGTKNWIAAGRVRLALENGDAAGMLLGCDRFRWNVALRGIFQAAVDFDAQRRHNGLALVAQTAIDAGEAGQVALQACCREGLDANEFWKIAGFEEICRLDQNAARGKHIIVWRKSIIPNFKPAWFYIPPPVHGYRAKRSKVV